MSKGCFWRHDWEKWGEVFEVTIMRRFHGDSEFRRAVEERQQRECERCGKIEERIL